MASKRKLEELHKSEGAFSESTSSESDQSSCKVDDPDYKPVISSASSSDELDSSPNKHSFGQLEDEDRNWRDSEYTVDKGQNLGTKGEKHEKKYLGKKSRKVQGLTVKLCTKTIDSKRVWDKKHFCFYCGCPQSKISRHLERNHSTMKDVAYAFSFPLGSKERKIHLEKLRNKGDFKHNAEVLEKGRGQLVTWKQPSEKVSVKEYLPCSYCYALFKKKDLWRHQSSCKSKEKCETDQRKMRRRVQSRGASLLPTLASLDGCKTVLNNMRQDDVSFHIRNDPLICKYGDSLYAKHGSIKSRHQYIAQRMRELGRFVLTAKEMDKNIKCLEDVCAPSKYQFVVRVAKRLTGFSPRKNEYKKASTAVKIGFCLKGAVEVLIGQNLMNEDENGEKKAKRFLELLENSWRNSVSVNAHQTIKERRWNQKDDIPLTKDVIALRDHLRKLEDEAKAELKHGFSLAAYKTLNETVLSQLIIFNKRREGEASRLTLDTYKEANTSSLNEDIFETLSPLEKELSKQLTRIEIRGKRGRKVPMFFTDRMKDSISLLIDTREEAGIPAENPFLFARSGGMTNIRGSDSLRKHAEASQAEHPELLRSTKLRKQVATLCQLLDLDEQELEQVARFMGHDIRVHRDFYRQTDKTFQITKISKLLFAMEQGPGTLKGKNLGTLELSKCEDITGSSQGVTMTDDDQTTQPDDDGSLADQSKMKLLEKRRTIVGRMRNANVRHSLCPPEKSGDRGMAKDSDSEDDDSLADQSNMKLLKKRRKLVGRMRNADVRHSLCPPEKNGERGMAKDSDSEYEKPKVGVKRRPWSTEEKEAIQKHLKLFVKERKVPGKMDCLSCIEKEKILDKRSWKDVKNFVYNTIVSVKRKEACRFLHF